MTTRPAIFKWRQTEPQLILCAVRWYLRYSLSLRDVEELLEERCLEADHTTVWRWVQRYGPELDHRLRRHLKPTNKPWRVDETYVKVHSARPGSSRERDRGFLQAEASKGYPPVAVSLADQTRRR